MPTWREERGGLEVASEGRKKTRLGKTYHAAKAEFGIEKVSSDQIFAGVGGMGTVWRGVGHARVRGRVLKGEEWIGEEVNGVSDAGGAGFGDEYIMTSVVGKRGGQPKATDTVVRPCQPFARRFMNDHELARRVDGMGTEIHRGTVEAVPGGKIGV
jgi:hypothetical protein